MAFILLLDNGKKWTINPVDFSNYLNNNFGKTELTEIKDSTRPYSFEFKITPNIEGFLHKDGDSIHFEGQFEAIYKLVILLRKFIPLKEKVLFFDDSYNNCIELTSYTTIGEIEKIFNH